MLRMNRVDQSRACALNPLALYFYNNVVYVETTHSCSTEHTYAHSRAHSLGNEDFWHYFFHFVGLKLVVVLLLLNLVSRGLLQDKLGIFALAAAAAAVTR